MAYPNGSRGESNALSSGEKRVAELRHLFGDTALLLAWPHKSKGGAKKWGHFTGEQMAETSYLLTLSKAGNIGLALGNKSVGLCAIDLDREHLRDEFLTENPWAAKTTQISGARGCKYIVRLRGTYPPTAHFHCRGEDVAQWLADGSQAIVAGIHPTGIEYRYTQGLSPLVIEYPQIRWPRSLSIPSTHRQFTEQQSNRAAEAIEQTSTRADEAFDAVVMGLVSKFLPTSAHQNNHLMFQIARGLKDVESHFGRPLSMADFRRTFDVWAQKARRYWREESTDDEYWLEFLDACKRARFGLDQNPLPAAWKAAQSSPTAPEAAAFQDRRLKMLVTLCSEIQKRVGDGSFFLPTRWLGEQLGVSHSIAARWLRGLQFYGFLHPVERGTSNRCPRYVFGTRDANP